MPPEGEVRDRQQQFPAGLRVLVVDDDPLCLMIVERMLRRCLYTGKPCCMSLVACCRAWFWPFTTCGRAATALSVLRENREKFDIVLSDVYMPDMDGFKLMELIGLEMNIPVIMMSANGETHTVMKGIQSGAVDYLLKPIRMEELRNIWQHVVRKTREPIKDLETSESKGGDKDGKSTADDDTSEPTTDDHDAWQKGGAEKKRKPGDEEDEERDELGTLKKPRVVWSVELHQQFVNAVNQLGIDKAVPKRILDLMNVQGLTRENVASHLQKYRLYLKRLSGVHQNASKFPNPSDAAALASSMGLTQPPMPGLASPQMPGLSGMDPGLMNNLAKLQAVAAQGNLNARNVLLGGAGGLNPGGNYFSGSMPGLGGFLPQHQLPPQHQQPQELPFTAGLGNNSLLALQQLGVQGNFGTPNNIYMPPGASSTNLGGFPGMMNTGMLHSEALAQQLRATSSAGTGMAGLAGEALLRSNMAESSGMGVLESMCGDVINFNQPNYSGNFSTQGLVQYTPPSDLDVHSFSSDRTAMSGGTLQPTSSIKAEGDPGASADDIFNMFMKGQDVLNEDEISEGMQRMDNVYAT
eukprot:jgi/Chlat1/3908/Chrsp26S04021